jgi:hypothetical protein
LEKRIADIEGRIALIEDEVARLSDEMSLPDVVANYEKFQDLSSKLRKKQVSVQELYEEWDAASSEL